MTNLNVITPLIRINNLPLLFENLLSESRKWKTLTFKLRWIVVVDEKLEHELARVSKAVSDALAKELDFIVCLNTVHNTGARRNTALEILSNRVALPPICNEWVYFLDDDNIIHPKLIPYLLDNNIFDTCGGIVVAQQWKNGDLRLDVKPDKIKPCHVDTASMVLSMDIIGETRWSHPTTPDGHFIQELYQKSPDKFKLVDEPLCYYNYLAYNVDECPVPLLQNMEEIKQCLSLYRALKPKKILEIGTFFGGTLYHWLKNAELTQAVSIDYPIPASDGRYQQMLDAKAKWKNWMLWDGFDWNYIAADSTHASTIVKANALFPAANIDFLFIDGGHDYKTVKSDYDNYSKLVRSGGIIAFHDIVCEGEVAQYWNDLKKTTTDYLEISQAGGAGIGIIFKK